MKNKKILIMVAVILLIVVIGVIGFTFAKYQSIGESNINPKVAKWHVLVNDVDISDGKTKTFDANIDWNQNDNIYNNGKTLIAPGSKGVVSFVINASTSEVSVKYNIKLDTSKLKDHKQIKITKITSTQDEKETIINATEEFNGLINLEEINKPVTIKVYIEWNPEINDDDDYNLGTKDIPLSIGVEVTISQKVNNTLAETIIKNAKEHKNEDSTIYKEKPETVPAQQVSGENERTLSMTEDDYGNSYYFRGNVQDNYLNFNNMCWRIVRIQGDGSVKLILEDKTKTCETATGGVNASIGNGMFGYKNTVLEYDYSNTLKKEKSARDIIASFITEEMKKNLKKENWCLGNTTDWFSSDGIKLEENEYAQNNSMLSESNNRLTNKQIATLKCDGVKDEKILDYGGMLTADEAVFSGFTSTGITNSAWLVNSSNIWYLLFTPSSKSEKQVSVFTIWKSNETNFRAAGIYDTNAYI